MAPPAGLIKLSCDDFSFSISFSCVSTSYLSRSSERRCRETRRRPWSPRGPVSLPAARTDTASWQVAAPPPPPPTAQERLPPWQQLIAGARGASRLRSSIQHLFVSLLDCVSRLHPSRFCRPSSSVGRSAEGRGGEGDAGLGAEPGIPERQLSKAANTPDGACSCPLTLNRSVWRSGSRGRVSRQQVGRLLLWREATAGPRCSLGTEGSSGKLPLERQISGAAVSLAKAIAKRFVGGSAACNDRRARYRMRS